MSDSPLPVTWLLPVRNGAAFLEETLEHLCAQTRPAAHIIAWDNGSTDDTVLILKRYIPTRLPGVIVTGNPLPLGESLGRSVQMAQTEYCARIDADDLCLPDRLTRQIAHMREHPHLDVLGGKALIIDRNSRSTGEVYDTPTTPIEIAAALLLGCPLIHPTVLFKRDAVLKAGNYRHGLKAPTGWTEDLDLWQRCAAKGMRLGNSSEIVIRYRVHSDSVTAGWRSNNELAARRAYCCMRNARSLFEMPPASVWELLMGEDSHKPALILKVLRRLAALSNSSLSEVLAATAPIAGLKSLLLDDDVLSHLLLSLSANHRGFAGLCLHRLRRSSVAGKAC